MEVFFSVRSLVWLLKKLVRCSRALTNGFINGRKEPSIVVTESEKAPVSFFFSPEVIFIKDVGRSERAPAAFNHTSMGIKKNCSKFIVPVHSQQGTLKIHFKLYQRNAYKDIWNIMLRDNYVSVTHEIYLWTTNGNYRSRRDIQAVCENIYPLYANVQLICWKVT